MSDEWLCRCGRCNAPEIKRCPRCGTWREDGEHITQMVCAGLLRDAYASERECPYCGNEITDESSVCSACELGE